MTLRMQGLVKLSERYPILDIRGRGLMVAVEFGGKDGSFQAEAGTATAVTKACASHSMLLLSAGAPVQAQCCPNCILACLARIAPRTWLLTRQWNHDQCDSHAAMHAVPHYEVGQWLGV